MGDHALRAGEEVEPPVNRLQIGFVPCLLQKSENALNHVTGKGVKRRAFGE
jgi:hypothetical protein